MSFVLVIAMWAATGQPMTAIPMPSRAECEATRAAMPPSDRVQWTGCVLVVAR